MAAKEEALSVHEAVQIASNQVSSIPMLTVVGEVSGFRSPNARSGHCYFQLKDEESSLDAIVWKGIYQSCGFELRDGLKIQITGNFNIYKASGKMSFVAKRISVAGEGLLRQQVDALARKLQAEGLMDPERKRKIPRFCTRIAVVTSLSGSVIDDVKRTLARRNPLVEIQVANCKVQGEGAPESIMAALDLAASVQPDAILLVRGGGSFEDLMTFNDEALARHVASMPVPVICGIGHEPDTSICDMVSDRRCSTPTAAAESVAPAIDDLAKVTADRSNRLALSMRRILEGERDGLDALSRRSHTAARATLSRLAERLDVVAGSHCLSNPGAFLEERAAQINLTEERLYDTMPRALAWHRGDLDREARRLSGAGGRLLRPYQAVLERSAGTLDALSPLKVLSRGYAIARDGEGHVIDSASKAAVGDEIEVLLGEGRIGARVTSVSEGSGE